MTGRPYDSGMIQEVLEVIDDSELAAGTQLIAETISPTITLKQRIAQAGQITLHRSPLFDLVTPEVEA